MRLLNTNTGQLREFWQEQVPKYAILSHRWGPEEVTFQEMKDGTAKTKKGLQKVLRYCEKAKNDGFQYAWIDTCCIDKTSSAELSESLNSMYQWYFQSDRCYAYLSDVQSIPSTLDSPCSKKMVAESEWFERGFTLQELLAPAEVLFLDDDWNEIGTKTTLQKEISDRTGIPPGILVGTAEIESASVAQRMSWAARRKTTRIEDRAYSLMGIFGVNMPLLYGEGERAFTRLQQEILRISGDQTLFAWVSGDTRGGLLATSPVAFEHSGNIVPVHSLLIPRTPLTVSNLGVHMEVRFLGAGEHGLGLATLNCKDSQGEDNRIGIFVRDLDWNMERFERVMSTTLEQVNPKRLDLALCSSIRTICIETHQLQVMRRSQDLGTNPSQKKYSVYGLNELAFRTDYGNSMELLVAAEEGRIDDVWLLFTQNDIQVNVADHNGRTALWMAIRNGHETIAQMLILRTEIDIHAVEKHGQGFVALAASQGLVDMARLLLDRGANVDARDHRGRTPLWEAIERDDMKMTRFLLTNGADVNAQDHRGCTPLWEAIQRNSLGMVKFLLDNGADPNITDVHGDAALGWAITIARVKKSPLNTKGMSDKTQRSIAAPTANEALVQLLIDNGACRDLRNEKGWTPLWGAAACGYDSAIRTLLCEDVDIDAKYGFGRTLLWVAVEAGHKSTVKLLLDRGASPYVMDDEGISPLRRATRRKPDDGIRIIMESAAGLNGQNHSRFNLPWFRSKAASKKK